MDFSVKHGFTYMAIMACVVCILSFLVPSSQTANDKSEVTVATNWNIIKTNIGGSTYSSDMDDGEAGKNVHINVKVTFDPAGGHLPADWENSKIVTTNEPYGVLPSPTKVGYVFTGWYTRAGYPITENENVRLGQDHTLYARWTQAQYTVEYYDGKTLLGHQKVYYEDVFDLLKFEDVTASKTGYHFYKWRDENDVAYEGGQNVKHLCSKDGDVLKLYIDWQPNEYTVNFDANEGIVSPTSKKVYFDDYYGTMPTASRQYYTFYGWYTAPDSSGTRINESDKYTIPNDTTLYAHWERNLYTITYVIDGNSYEYTAYQGEPVEAPDTSKPGYTFKGWFNKEVGGTQITDFAYTTQTVYAQYTPNNYVVRFDPNGGTVETTEKTVTYDNTYGTLPIPVRVGYVFQGWFLGDGSTQIKESTTVKILQNTTLTAKWKASQYTIAYYSDAKKITESTHTYDTENNLKTIAEMKLTKKGYIFQGWSRIASSTTVEFKDGATVSNLSTVNGSTINIYAVWKPITYKIEYYNVNLFGTSTHTYDKKSKLTSIDTLKMNKPGYTFKGWATSQDSNEIIYKDAQEILNLTDVNGAVIKLYAVWGNNTYTVTYYDRGNNVGTSTYTYDKEGTLKSYEELNMEKTGYHFKGWAINENDKNVTYKDKATIKNLTTVPDGNVNLYAIWEANTYTINYYNEGVKVGSTVFTYDVTSYLTKAVDLKISKTGYSFEGWGKSSSSPAVDFTDGDTIKNLTTDNNAVINLYAKWSANTYVVSFDPNGGECNTATKDVVYDSIYGLLPIASRVGYQFDGWFYNGTQINADTTVKVASDHTLTAKWTANTYTIEYYDNSGENKKGSTAMTYDIAKNLTTIQTLNYTKTGYTFQGWGTSVGTTKVVYKDGQSVKNLTSSQNGIVKLYAVWKANTYTVKYNGNGNTGGSTASSTHTYDTAKKLTKNGYIKTGYDFKNWSTYASGAGTKYEDEASVINLASEQDAIVNLYAQWTPRSYTVGYYSDNNKIGSSTHVYDTAKNLSTITELNLKKTGYIFQGWDTSSTAKTVVYQDGQSVINLVSTNDEFKLYAVWKPITYTVKYNGNGNTGGSTASSTHTYDEAKSLTTNGFTKTGYTFKGWTTSATSNTVVYNDKASVVNLSSTDGATVNLYAVWKAKTYTVTFDPNGGSVSPTTKEVTYDSTYGTLPTPTRTGYTFQGWFLNDTQITSSATVKITANTTLVAHWKANTYTVKYNGNGNTGGSTASSTHTYDITQSLTKNGFTRTGYTFKGWATSANGTKVYSDEEEVINLASTQGATVNLYAVWKANTYNVSFDANGGDTPVASKPVTYDGTYGVLPTPTRTGYTFIGWYTDASAGTQVTAATVVKTPSDHTLYAHWQANVYTVNFYHNDTKVHSIDMTYDIEYTVPTASTLKVTKTGYTFQGWTKDTTTNSILFNDGAKVKNLTPSGEVNVYSVWKANTYTVKYNGNGNTGGSTASSSHTYDVAKTLTANGFTKTGYTFKGWGTSATATTVAYNDKASVKNLTATPNGTYNLYALWQAKTYTVTFDPNGGSVSPTTKEVTYDSTYGTLPTPTRTGYTFQGWFLNDTQITASTTVKITANTTLVAHWSANTYTIKYNGNGATGGSTASSSHIYDVAKELTTNGFVKTGYSFLGWSQSSNATTATYQNNAEVINLASTQGATVNLYAVWKANSYTVSFNANGGTTSTASKSVTYDGTYGVLPTPTKTGYTFAGWYTDASAGTQVTASTTVQIASNHTLYAHWTANPFTVNFYHNGTKIHTMSMTYDVEYTVPTASTLKVTKTGYTFQGWTKDTTTNAIAITDGATIKNFATSGEVNVYSVWKANTYTVKYNGNGNTGGSTASSSHTYDVAKTLNANGFTKTGYTFKGWGTSATATTVAYNDKASVKNLTATPNGTYNLYALWQAKTYTVTFDPNGGSVSPTTKEVTYDSTYGTLPTPTKTGYLFSGWYLGDTVITSSTTVKITQNTTLTAKWTNSKYTVEYYDRGTKKGYSSHTFDSKTPLTTATELGLSYSGYTFKGWATSSNSTNIVYTDGQEVLNLSSTNGTVIKLYAVWGANTYTVTFNPNNGTTPTASKSVTYDGTYGVLPTPTRTGYTFTGWFTTAGAGTQVTSSTIVKTASNHTLYAHWTANTYTLEFYHNGNKVHSMDMTYDIAATVPTVASLNISKTGYSFAGWTKNTSTNAIAFKDGASIKNQATSGTAKVYSVWTANNYTVTFNPNGGSVSPTSKTVTFDSSYGDLPTPTKAGYTFAGWYNGNTQVASGTTVTTASNHTLTARWSVNTNTAYTVKHYLMNVNGVGYTLNKTETLYGPTDTSVTFNGLSKNFTGFTYKEAKVDGSSIASTDSSTTIKGDGSRVIHLYYSRNQYTLTILKGTGISTATATGTYYYGANTSVTATVSTGYTFSQWTSSNASLLAHSTQIDYAFKMPAGNISLTANTTANTYTITYNDNGGTGGPGTQKFKYNSGEKFSSIQPTKTGYIFSGWTYNNQTYQPNGNIPNGIQDFTVTAKWTPITYTVKYNGNGNTGGSTASSSHTYDVSKALTSNGFTKTGYVFQGWATSSSSSTVAYSNGASVKNLSSTNGATVNLYAVWKAATYTVTFAPNGGSVSPTSKSVTYNSTYGDLPTPTKAGYTFAGWYSGTTQITSTTTVATASNHTLTAHWTCNTNTAYTVKHYLMNVNGIGYTLNKTDSLTGTTDATVTFDSVKKTYTGFTYQEIKLDGSSTATTTTSTTIKGDGSRIINIYYSRNQYALTVSKGTGIASVSGAGTYYYGASVSAAMTVSTGYTFKQWTSSNTSLLSNSTSSTYAFTMPAGAIILTATATANTYTITYNDNGGTGGPGTQNFKFNSGEKFSTVKPTRTGYIFAKWVRADNTSYTFNPGDSIPTGWGSFTVNAQWTPITYTIAYNGNGNTGGSTASSTHTYDVAKALTSNGFTKTGYTFKNWNTKADGSGTSYANGASVKNLSSTSGATVTLYAQWTAKTYTITYNANGGSGTMNNQSATYNQTVSIAANSFTKTGYTFAGWTTKTDGTDDGYGWTGWSGTWKYIDGQYGIANGKLTLYARWTANTYTIAYNGNGNTGGSTASSSHTYDVAKALTSNGFTKTGYTFKNWNTKADGSGTSYANGASVKNLSSTSGATVTLYAQWTANTYTIAYNGNGNTGGSTASSTHTYDVSKKLTANGFTKTGYTFKNWNTKADGSGTSYANGASVKNLSSTSGATVTLYAQWIANTYTIVYNGNGNTGGSTASSTHTYDVAKALTSNGFTKTGYTFKGWATSSTSSTVTYTNGASVKNLTTTANGTVNLYAVWSINSYNLTINPNGGAYNGSTSTQTFTDKYSKLKLVGIPAKTGYTFTNWTLSGSGNISRYGTSLNNDTFFKTGTNGVSVYNNSGNGVVTHTRQASQSDNPTGSGYEIKIYHNGGTSSPGLGGFVQTTKSSSGAVYYHVFTAKVPVGYNLNIAMNATGDGRSYSWVTSNKGTGEYETYIYKLTCGTTGTFSTFGHVYLSGSGPVTWYLAGSTVLNATNGTSQPSSAQVYTYGAGTGTITANWSANTYTVKYDGNGATSGSTASSTHTYNTSKALTANGFSKTGYSFAGWSTNKSATSATYSDKAQVTNLTSTANGTVTLYAIWTANSYNVIYNGNGATNGSTATSTHTYNIAKTLTANGFVRTGYTFNGWNTKADGSGTSYTNQQSVTNLSTGSDVTLYAKWKANTYTNTIHHWATGFKNSEGNNSSKNQYNIANTTFTANYNTSFTMNDSKKATVPNGFTVKTTFDTASITGTSTAYNFGTSVTQTSSAMSFDYYYQPTSYSITYNLAGGTNNSANPSTYNVLYGVSLKAPTRTGYKFTGWYNGSTKVTGINEGKNATFSSASDLYSQLSSRTTGNITLTAHWEQAIFTVTYNGNGGTSPASVQKQATVALGTLPTSTRTGYQFAGWYTAASGGTKISSTTIMPSNDVTYYAHWTANTYTIIYNGNGNTGGSTASSSHSYGTAKALTANGFTKTGYTFKGWATSSGSTTVTYTDKQSVSNLTTTQNGTINLYAVWQINSYRQIVQIRYENADGTYTNYETVVDKNYNYNSSFSWSRAKDACYEAKSLSYTVTAAKTTQLSIMRNKYTLAVAGLLNGSNTTNLGSFGKNDVYINGSLSVSATSSYSVAQRYGSTYEIKNIVANSGYKYMGVSSGSLTGTITSATTVRLNFNSVYSINFYSNKTLLGSLSNIAYTESKALTTGASLNATLSGYTFVGWDTVYFGDINKDGNVNSTDVTLVTNHINGSSTLSSEQKVLADLNRTETVDSTDKTLINNIISGSRPYMGARIVYDDGQSVSKLTSTPNGVINMVATYTDISAIASSKTSSLTFPVGYVLQTTSSTNPGTTYGGTWSQIAQGRTLVGVDESDSDFSTVEKTGGESTITLTTDQLPSHVHTGSTNSTGNHKHAFNSNASATYGVATASYTGDRGVPYIAKRHGKEHLKRGDVSVGTNDNHTHTFTTNATGGSGAHNNMQPYYVVYIWKKTAN